MGKSRNLSVQLTSLLVVAGLLAGCGARFSSIHRNVRLPDGASAVQLIDAKQRAIITVPVPGQIELSNAETAAGDSHLSAAHSLASGQVRVCSEPSPDVFSTIAAAATANGSFGQSKAPSNINLDVGLSGATSEQGATIGRTQTINLLKEMMYRTCERYINNGIGSLELSVQAARDQRLIVATLAIEQLTGVVMPKATIIGSFGDTAGGGSAAAAVVAIDEAQKAQAAAQKAEKTANDAYAEASKDGKKDDACAQIAAAKDPANPGDALKDKVEGCKEATAAQVAAQGKLKTANDNLAALKQAMNSGGGLVTSATTSVQTNSGSGGIDQAKAQSVEDVTAAVQEIVKMNYATDEFELLCIKIIDRDSGAGQLRLSLEAKTKIKENDVTNLTLNESCLAYFNTKLAKSRAMNDAEIAEIESFTAQLLATDAAAFDDFWLRVSKHDSLASDQLTSIVNAAIALKPAQSAKGPLNRLAKSTTRAELQMRFKQLPKSDRILLTTK